MALLVNHLQKWAFIHIPKTGGTSISNILLEEDGTEKITGHDSIRQLENTSDYYIFTFVRNPFTRIQSAHQHSLRKKVYNYNFGDFLHKVNPNDLWVLPQTYFINAGNTHSNKISFIGRYESYERDVYHVFSKLKINKRIPRLNYNPIFEKHPKLKDINYYKHFYTEEWMKDWVRERYKDDFKQFNYELEI